LLTVIGLTPGGSSTVHIYFILTTDVTPHSDHFTRRQAAQRSPIFQLSLSRPRVLI